jgi:lycopene cyclase domain-containing protein
MERYLYLTLCLFSLSFPLLRSFEHRITFWRKWKGLFTGIVVMSAVFLPWDIVFTADGVWGFNDRYLIGVRMAGLPLEEWLFFLTIPYACMFIYEVLRFYVKRDVLGRIARPMATILSVVLLVVGLIYLDRAYTSVTFIATAVFLGLHALILKSPWLGRFFVGYGVSLIPFFLVNGLLTGSWIDEPVVWYNNAETLGIRLGSIPLEDSIYLLLLLLMVTTFYELPLQRRHDDLHEQLPSDQTVMPRHQPA